MSRRYFKKKRMKKIKPAVLIIPAAVIVAAVIIILIVTGNSKEPVQRYLSSDTSGVSYYIIDKDEDRIIKSSSTLPRGIKIIDTLTTYQESGREYEIIEYDGATYYVLPESITDDPDNIVTEERLYLKYPATIYKSPDSAEIISYAEKGEAIDIIGYDEINEDGTVTMYEISLGDASGWVYQKYTVLTKSEADEVNTEYYNIHNGRMLTDKDLYGGMPEDLNWWPLEKPSFEDNPICDGENSLYINASSLSDIDSYIKLAKTNNITSFVIDIKDCSNGGGMAYHSEATKEISPSAYEKALYSVSEFKEIIQKIKDEGFYIIGRIVAFNDKFFCEDNPDECIDYSASSNVWPSAYSRRCWYYNVAIAVEAVELFGINEIQFDYARFPETSYTMTTSGIADFKNKYGEEKCEAVQNFLMYACDQIHNAGAYVSCTVSAECTGTYVTAYGQYYPSISLIVDAISATPYPDRFSEEAEDWLNPYDTVYSWAVNAAKRQAETPNPALARTWVAAYSLPYWNPSTECDAAYVADEIQALYDAGLTGGAIAYNSKADLTAYRKIAAALGKTYTSKNK